MGKNTLIEWADHTWNPWVGCPQKLSPGCDNCYMYRDQKRFGNDPTKVRRTKDPTFYAPISKFNIPACIFVCSYSDFFLPEADEWRNDAWQIIKDTPHHTYYILTKRPENIADRLPPGWPAGYEHVALGITAEDDQRLVERYEVLIQTRAPAYFISAEPLLGPLPSLRHYISSHVGTGTSFNGEPAWFTNALKWVIVGGESGGNARPLDPAWAFDIYHLCKKGKVLFNFKQWGEWLHSIYYSQLDPELPGRYMFTLDGIEIAKKDLPRNENAHVACYKRVGRKRAGREFIGGDTYDDKLILTGGNNDVQR